MLLPDEGRNGCEKVGEDSQGHAVQWTCWRAMMAEVCNGVGVRSRRGCAHEERILSTVLVPDSMHTIQFSGSQQALRQVANRIRDAG